SHVRAQGSIGDPRAFLQLPRDAIERFVGELVGGRSAPPPQEPAQPLAQLRVFESGPIAVRREGREQFLKSRGVEHPVCSSAAPGTADTIYIVFGPVATGIARATPLPRRFWRRLVRSLKGAAMRSVLAGLLALTAVAAVSAQSKKSSVPRLAD